MTDELLEAVDALTKPDKSKVMQQNKAGISCLSPVELPSLLEQLEEAIRSDLGSTARGASLAHERSILDADALFRFMVITSQIKEWCRIVGITPDRSAGENLRAWYVATLSRQLDDAGAEFYVSKMRQWANLIRAKLDPARERELPDACPTCGAREWWRDGEKYFHPLVIRYRPTGPDMVQQARAMCRACEQVWRVRELAYALEHADQNADAG